MEMQKPEVVFMDTGSGREYDLPMDKLNDAGKAALIALKPKPPFPIIWMSTGDIQPLLDEGRKSYNHWPPMVLDYQINNFRMYVNEKDYFMSGLPGVTTKVTIESYCSLI